MPVGNLMQEQNVYTGKLALRLASIAFAIIAAGMLGKATVLQDGFSTDGMGGAIDGIALAAPVLSFVWSPTSLILLACLRRKRKSYHPGIDIGLDFVCFGLALSMGALVIWWNVWVGGVEGYSSNWSGSNRDGRAGAEISGFEAAGGSFCILLAAVHLLLFVAACHETHARRMAKKHKTGDFEVGKNGDGAVELELQHQEPVRK